MQRLTYVMLINLAHYYEKRPCQLCARGQLPLNFAIFEFGRSFYGDTYISVLSGLTLTPGRLQMFCNWKSWAGLGTKLTYVLQPVANK